MAVIALIVAFIAFVIASRAQATASALRTRLEEAESAGRRALMAAEDSAQNTQRNTAFLKLLANGNPIDAEMVDEGRLFPEIDAEQARSLIEGAGREKVRVLDVRTEQEVVGGHIDGALWIPVDQLEKRVREVPKDGRVLVVCAAGSRSAAACDHLSTRGWNNVANVIGGMSAYRGKTVSGKTPGG
jgi:rhodanese-related sulfurtransferase